MSLAAAANAPTRRQPLLKLDPALGDLLPPDRRALAEQTLVVEVRRIAARDLELAGLRGASPGNLGLLVIDGIVSREVLVGDTVSTELLGPGDLIRPWALHPGGDLLGSGLRWRVLPGGLTAALLDMRFSIRACRYPEVNVALVDRVNERASRLAVTKAVSQLKRVDRRLTALFAHLAERWGRMTGEGIVVPLRLSHRALGEIIGARRPTVSAALMELALAGELIRRDDGSWLVRTDGTVRAFRAEHHVAPARPMLVPV